MSTGNLVGVDELNIDGGVKPSSFARAYGGTSGYNTLSDIFDPAVQKLIDIDVDMEAISYLLTFLAIIGGLIFLWQQGKKSKKQQKRK